MAKKRAPKLKTLTDSTTRLLINDKVIPADQEQAALTEFVKRSIDGPAEPEATTAVADPESPPGPESNGHAEAAEPAPEPPAPDHADAEESLRRIAEAEREVAEAEAEMDRAKKFAKAKTAEWESAVEHLRDVIRDETRKEVLPLFDRKPEPGATSAAAVGDDDAWRKELLPESLGPHGVSSALLVKLAEAELITMGDLADWTAKKGKTLNDVPGVGEASARKIDDALAAFWASRPKPAPEDKWREVKLSALQLDRDVIRSLDGLETVGEIADALQGDSIENLVGWNEGHAHALRIALQWFRRERGGAVLEGLPESRLEPEGGSDGDDEYGD